MAHDTRDHASAQPIGGSAFVPLAEGLPSPPEENLPTIEAGEAGTTEDLPIPRPIPFPPGRFCFINLREGCYRTTFQPNGGFFIYRGTMRVENSAGRSAISGDLYRFLRFVRPFPVPISVLAERIDPGLTETPPSDASPPLGIPIYPRNKCYSYLKITGVRKTPLFSSGPCRLTLTAEEYVYNQPPAGSFNGTFPAAPTRTVTLVLSPAAAPAGYTSSYFEGKLYEGGAERGSFTMGWVSSYFRRATLEISCVANTVAPQPVGSEDFRTVFATAGWDVNYSYDSAPLPIPAGTTSLGANICPSSADLHALMSTIHTPGPHLDREWRLHVLVVPGKMGCGRGVMFDQTGAHREGVASFCDDGYPGSDSSNFGTAANKKQREIPRAFMRSACHEVGHGFNQIHQEQEAGADNSIMTTTPSVANVLGGPTTGAPGVFPDNINLAFNGHVRHHLIHFPDPAVRPGAMNFGAGHSTTVPQADQERFYLSADVLELRLAAASNRLKLGEPLELSWTLTNKSPEPVSLPNDLSLEAQHVHVTVVSPDGVSRYMPSFVVRTDGVTLRALGPDKELKEETQRTRLFWSSNGFAFEKPGKHRVEVRLLWSDAGIPYGVLSTVDVWVDYAVSDADNEVASLLMDDEVGMFVALGGGSHLTNAVARIETAGAKHGKHPACQCVTSLPGQKYSAKGAKAG